MPSQTHHLQGHRKELPGVDAKRFTSENHNPKWVQLLVKIYRYKGRGVSISLGFPLPERTPLSRPAPPNLIAKALEIRTYLENNPTPGYKKAAIHFKITRSRICQMMKIIETFPPEFTNHIRLSSDRELLNRFSGRTLLRIAALPGMADRRAYVQRALAALE